MQHECNFLSFWRKFYFGCPRCAYLAHEVFVYLVGNDIDIHLLWLLSLFKRVDFAVVAVAQCAVVCHCKEADRVLLVERKLLFATAVNIALVDVERTVFLAQVVVGVVVTCPYGCSVFAVEVGQLGIVALAVKPNVACYGRTMVFTEVVFVAFCIVIENVAIASDADIVHCHRRIKAWTTCVDTHFVSLWECSRSKEDRLCRRHTC